MAELRPTRAQGAGAALLTGSFVVQVGNWIAFFVGLPGNLAFWRDMALSLGEWQATIPPYWAGVFLGHGLLILGLLFLGPTLASWYVAAFRVVVDRARRRRALRQRQEWIRGTLVPLWRHYGEWLTELVNGPAEVQVSKRIKVLEGIGVIEVRTPIRTDRPHGPPQFYQVCALTPEAMPVVRALAGLDKKPQS